MKGKNSLCVLVLLLFSFSFVIGVESIVIGVESTCDTSQDGNDSDNSDCSEGYLCYQNIYMDSGVCFESCDEDSDCDIQDEACFVGYCFQRECFSSDSDDSLIEKGYSTGYTIDNVLGISVDMCNSLGLLDEASCSSDGSSRESNIYNCEEELGEGYYCSNGACVIDVECESDVDCDDGFACDSEGSCVEYCALGETECSDGIDNDSDGTADYEEINPYCLIDDVIYSCDPASYVGPFGSSSTCYIEYNGIPSTCIGTLVYETDLECRSPYDTDESSDPKCADGIDNDGDEWVDYPFDSDCENPESDLEGSSFYAAPEYSLWDWIKSLFNF